MGVGYGVCSVNGTGLGLWKQGFPPRIRKKSTPSAYGANMARRARTAEDLVSGPVAAEGRFHAAADGSLSNSRVERFALFLADEVPATKAWALAGYTDVSGYAKDWRKRVERDPVFQERVRGLMAEKAESEADPSPFAAARWTAKQLWRDARAVGDIRASEKAADLLFKIGDREVTWLQATGGAAAAPAVPSGRGPGRPPIEVPAAVEAAPSEIARRLLGRGREADA